jgi:hypothetical protein
MKKFITGIFLALVVLLASSHAMDVYAKGGGGGGHSSGGGHASSSARSSSSSSKSTSTSKTSTASKPSTPKVSTKPSSSTKSVTSSKPITKNGKTFSKTGKVTDSTYQPKFKGYTAPVGSTVYYRDNGGMSWLPFYFLWMSSNREAVVQEPSKDGVPGKETVVKEEGTDTMYIVNWAITILVGLGLIGIIVYLIYRHKRK